MRNFIDMHCDTLLKAVADGRLYDNASNMLDIRRMVQAGQCVQFFAVFFPPNELPEGAKLPDNYPKTDGELFSRARSLLLDTVSEHSGEIAMAYCASDIEQNMKNGLASALLTIEDGRIVQGDSERLQWLYSQGTRAIGLTWNARNCFGYPNIEPPYTMEESLMRRGLTDFGRDAVSEMNALGMLIDVSHLSDGGFFDVAKITKKPFVATHSNSRMLCNHPRNLTDEMIRTLAGCGGVSGLNFVPDFVSEGEGKTTVEGLCRHVLHFINVGGEDIVALGTDFDGFEGDIEIGEPGEMQLLFDVLERHGVTPRVLDKLAYGNVLRVLKDVL